jgi:stage II sporulation protein AA (anti-sigma F factor antagonist)
MIQYKKPNKERKIFNMCAARDRKPGFDSEFTGTVLKIKLRGEIDHHSAVAVRTAIDDMIRAKKPMELLIDMSAVDFMDSSGLGLIMGRYNTMKEMGGRVTVADPTPATEKIMKLAGIERIVRIAHSNAIKTSNATVVQSAPIMALGKSEHSASSKQKRTEKEGKKQ